MISKRIPVFALVIMMLACLFLPAAALAGPVEEAKQLQEAGDATGAFELLKKAKADLTSKLKKKQGRTEIPAFSSFKGLEHGRDGCHQEEEQGDRNRA